jgi:hypothetical protein
MYIFDYCRQREIMPTLDDPLFGAEIVLKMAEALLALLAELYADPTVTTYLAAATDALRHAMAAYSIALEITRAVSTQKFSECDGDERRVLASVEQKTLKEYSRALREMLTAESEVMAARWRVIDAAPETERERLRTAGWPQA